MGLFSDFGKKIAHYIFELLAIVVIFIMGLVLTIYATQAHSQCKKSLNGEHGDIPEEDKIKYQEAAHNLQWIVSIGWTIVALSIVVFVGIIVAVVFGAPEELGAEAGLMTEELLGKEAQSFITRFGRRAYKYAQDLNLKNRFIEFTKKKDKSLWFHSFFGGWIMTTIFALMFLTLFILGIFAAMASVKLSHTKDKYGQGKAQAAAIIGLVPFSIFIVWFLADAFYRWRISNKIEEVKQQMEANEASARQSTYEEQYTPRRSAPPPPTPSPPPQYQPYTPPPTPQYQPYTPPPAPQYQQHQPPPPSYYGQSYQPPPPSYSSPAPPPHHTSHVSDQLINAATNSAIKAINSPATQKMIMDAGSSLISSLLK